MLSAKTTSASSRPLRQLPITIQEKLREDFPMPNIGQAKQDFFALRKVKEEDNPETKQQVEDEFQDLFTKFVKQEKNSTLPYKVKSTN